MALDRGGNMFVGEMCVVRKITPSGESLVLAGCADSTGVADGIHGGARFSHISSLCMDTAGWLFVFDAGRVRSIGPNGMVNTLAGRIATPATRPMDGKGAAACFGRSGCITCGNAGYLLVMDFDFDLVRLVSRQGMVQTLGGKSACALGASVRGCRPPVPAAARVPGG